MDDTSEIKQLNIQLDITIKQLTRTLDVLERLMVLIKEGVLKNGNANANGGTNSPSDHK